MNEEIGEMKREKVRNSGGRRLAYRSVKLCVRNEEYVQIAHSRSSFLARILVFPSKK